MDDFEKRILEGFTFLLLDLLLLLKISLLVTFNVHLFVYGSRRIGMHSCFIFTLRKLPGRKVKFSLFFLRLFRLLLFLHPSYWDSFVDLLVKWVLPLWIILLFVLNRYFRWGLSFFIVSWLILWLVGCITAELSNKWLWLVMRLNNFFILVLINASSNFDF